MRVPTVGGSAATPGALMFIGGLALMYWALAGWGLFGLGQPSMPKIFGGQMPKTGFAPVEATTGNRNGSSGSNARVM